MTRRTEQSVVVYALLILFSSKFICEAKSLKKAKERPVIRLEGKVVGGVYTDIKKFPHAVFLLTKCGENNMLCGSSVVNQKILITAAHCLVDCRDKSIDAYAGHENLNQVTILRKVGKTVAHRHYDDNALHNDIGLVLLTKNLPLGDYIKRVIIKREHRAKVVTSVAGWGITNDDTKERTMLLKSVEQPLCSRSACSIIGSLHDGMLCAGSVKTLDHRPSRGDSGSGLVTSDYQQIGLVSFRNDAYPALLVYTNVSYYYDWIRQISKKLYCADFIK